MRILERLAKPQSAADYRAAADDLRKRIADAKTAVDEAKRAVGAAAFDGNEDQERARLIEAQRELEILTEQLRVAEERRATARIAEAEAAIPQHWNKQRDLLSELHKKATEISRLLNEVESLNLAYSEQSGALQTARPDRPRNPRSMLIAKSRERGGLARHRGVELEKQDHLIAEFFQGNMIVGRDYSSTELAALLASVKDFEFEWQSETADLKVPQT